jgi:hypothetical protein
MRTIAMLAAVALGAAAIPAGAVEQVPAFDACQVFTQADAEAALGGPAQPPPENPKVKQRPKVIPACTYTASREGKVLVAGAHFRFGKTDAEADRAFEESRLQLQTKPFLIRGADAAFWSARTGEMNVRKGRTWVSLAVGPEKPADRDMDVARKAAEALVKKL